MRNFKIALGILPIAFDLLVPRLAALRQIVALDLLPEMLIWVYEKKTLGHQSAWYQIETSIKIFYGCPNYRV